MNIEIWNHAKTVQYVGWAKGQFNGLTYTHELPGGMKVASFNVPSAYRQYHPWADIDNQVFIKEEAEVVWQGLIYDLSKPWGDSGPYKVDCGGLASKLMDFNCSVNPSAEKASTYIVDHILADPRISPWISAGLISTDDYLIPGTIDVQPEKKFRDILDGLYSYNQYTHDWYIWGDLFYWLPIQTNITYIARTYKRSKGEVRQGKGEMANYIKGWYRDANGVWSYVTAQDTASKYELKEYSETYSSNNMTAAQAQQLCNQTLETRKYLGTNAQIEVTEIYDVLGNKINVAKIKPGRIIRLGGLVPAVASIQETYIANDLDTFAIQSVTYDHDSRTAKIGPGKLPYTLQRALSRIGR